MTRGRILALLVLAALVAGLAFVRFDLDAFREPLADALSEQAGRPVELGGLTLRLLPLPYVEIRDLAVGGATPGDPPFLEVAHARLQPHPVPLLLRRTLEVTLELRAPVVRAEPGMAPIPVPGEVPSGSRPEPSGDPPGEGDPLPLVLRGVRITDGVVSYGAIRAEHIQASGRLGADGAGRLDLDLDLPGLGDLRDVRIFREAPSASGEPIAVTGRLRDGSLEGLGKLLGEELAGKIAGSFEVSLLGTEIRKIEVQVQVADGVIADPPLWLDGAASLSAETSGPLELDLTRLALRGTVRKPAGVVLRAVGRMPATVPAARLEGLQLEVANARVTLDIALPPGPPSVTVRPGSVLLGPLVGLGPSGTPPVEGVLRVETPLVLSSHLEVRGRAVLEGVRLPLEAGVLSLNGTVEGRGTTVRIAAPGLRVELAEQEVKLGGRFRPLTGEFELDVSTEGADLESLGQALAGRAELTGLLTTSGHLAGRAAAGEALLEGLLGDLRVEVTDGSIRGFSLAEAVLGELVALPVLVARVRGKDLSRYNEQEFEELSGDFHVEGGRVRTRNLRIRYRHATARLRGSVGLVDGSLNLSGSLTLARELDAELGAGSQARERVIPIAGIGGTVARPRVELDNAALLSVAETYLSRGKLREKIEERVGPGGAEAIQGILEQLLGGGQKKR